jgi:fructose-1,6-bisphosphatase/inositol monophosphatase family enzyme
MKEELCTLLELAKQAASAGAEVHQRAIAAGHFSVATKASAADLVTEIDRASEAQIVSVIRAARPQDGILGEEGTNDAGSTGVRWILDPLDGTTNFVHRYPAHAVAVGVEIDGSRVLGVVFDTFSKRVYAGIVGQGATCDGQPIAVRNELVCRDVDRSEPPDGCHRPAGNPVACAPRRTTRPDAGAERKLRFACPSRNPNYTFSTK